MTFTSGNSSAGLRSAIDNILRRRQRQGAGSPRTNQGGVNIHIPANVVTALELLVVIPVVLLLIGLATGNKGQSGSSARVTATGVPARISNTPASVPAMVMERTSTPQPTRTPVSISTPVPPQPTSPPPATNTAVPPRPTNTVVPPTRTSTPVPPTRTPTPIPVSAETLSHRMIGPCSTEMVIRITGPSHFFPFKVTREDAPITECAYPSVVIDRGSLNQLGQFHDKGTGSVIFTESIYGRGTIRYNFYGANGSNILNYNFWIGR